MKFLAILAFTAALVCAAPIRQQIVYLTGESAIGRVVNMDADTVVFQPLKQDVTVKIPLDTLLYIHNGEGKLFYISETLWRIINRSLGRGGVIITTDGREIPFVDLGEELYMYYPKLTYYTTDTYEKRSIRLEDIHKLMIDHSLSEYAVRRGFYVAGGASLIAYLIQFRSTRQFLNFELLYNRVFNVYPKAVTIMPLVTLGWVVYDYLFGIREFVINPLKAR